MGGRVEWGKVLWLLVEPRTSDLHLINRRRTTTLAILGLVDDDVSRAELASHPTNAPSTSDGPPHNGRELNYDPDLPRKCDTASASDVVLRGGTWRVRCITVAVGRRSGGMQMM